MQQKLISFFEIEEKIKILQKLKKSIFVKVEDLAIEMDTNKTELIDFINRYSEYYRLRNSPDGLYIMLDDDEIETI